MKHELKSFRAEIKAYDTATGVVEAIVSVFNNVDLGGDRVVPGAFSKTLQEWQTKGDPIPVIWSHEWDDPTSHIGIVTDIAERPEGLWTKMLLDVEANPKAAYVARLLKQRRVTQFSFGYYTRDSKMVTDADGTPVRELLDIELFEVGPTLLGMNPATQLLEAASRSIRDAKAGRVLSGKNEEALVQARDLIDGVLSQLAVNDDTPKSALLELKATADEVAEGVFVSFTLGDDIEAGRIEHVMTEGILGVPDSPFQLEASADDPAVLIRMFDDQDGTWIETEMFVGRRASEVNVIEPLTEQAAKSATLETKAEAPGWMRDNARQGLAWYEEGLAGDGVVDATLREAREIAGGNVTDAKARKMFAWFSRHMVDLDAPAADPDHDDYPSPGVVAHALWGGGSKSESERALAWAERRVAQLERDEKSVDQLDTIDEADTEDTSGSVSRDTPTNINNDHTEIQYLLTRPKHTEDNQ